MVPTGLTDHKQVICTASTQVAALKLNIQRITFLASINEINAHKNKYSTFGAKLSPTPSLV
jgi:hypothetical protein